LTGDVSQSLELLLDGDGEAGKVNDSGVGLELSGLDVRSDHEILNNLETR
jgi:hypothetical protein